MNAEVSMTWYDNFLSADTDELVSSEGLIPNDGPSTTRDGPTFTSQGPTFTTSEEPRFASDGPNFTNVSLGTEAITTTEYTHTHALATANRSSHDFARIASISAAAGVGVLAILFSILWTVVLAICITRIRRLPENNKTSATAECGVNSSQLSMPENATNDQSNAETETNSFTSEYETIDLYEYVN